MNPDPEARFEARHFDGRTAESHPVTAWVDGEGVWVSGAGGSRCWPFADLVLMRGEGRDEQVQLERRSAPVEVLIVPDRAFLARLRAALPAGTRLARSGGGSPSLRAVGALLLAGITLLFVLYRFAIPALADFAADRVPPEWERSLGATVLAGLVPVEDLAEDPRLLLPAREIRRQLGGSAAVGAGEGGVLVHATEVPNAFAVPGGTVVVTTGLLRALRSPDELAAVLAHEQGHVQRGHVMRSIMRRLSLNLLLGLVAGDQSALSGGLLAAGELGALSYSREYEREADDEAVALLSRLGASPLALADALESIARTAPSGPSLGFLSTHPAPEERAKRIRAAAAGAGAPEGAPPWKSAAGWEEMKAALAEAPPHDEHDAAPMASGAEDSPRPPAQPDPARDGLATPGAEEGLPRFGEYVYVEELPEAITKVPPEYPELARRSSVEGVVMVQALVGRDGRVKDTRVAKSIPLLDQAAVTAVRQWVFQPALAGGKPVAVWVAIPVRFTLK